MKSIGGQRVIHCEDHHILEEFNELFWRKLEERCGIVVVGTNEEGSSYDRERHLNLKWRQILKLKALRSCDKEHATQQSKSRI